MEKTAVEWLVEQLARKHNEFQALTFYHDHNEEIEQAKAMEKDQMKNMYLKGIENYDPTFKRKSQWTEATESTFNSYRRPK
jgi:hypothetical protein